MTESQTDLYRVLEGLRCSSETRTANGTLVSRFGRPASEEVTELVWGDNRLPVEQAGLPAELVSLWRYSSDTWLFYDQDYGQWGLHFPSPEECWRLTKERRELRPEDTRLTDVVVAEFRGDSELLIMTEDSASPLLIVAPIDPRSDWYAPASTLTEFLIRYQAAFGDKYWES